MLLLFADVARLLIYSIIPVVLKNYSASPALGSVAEGIMGSDMRPVCSIVAITDIRFEPSDSHSCNSLKDGFTFERRYFFVDVVDVFNVKIDP
jgi:hypothetical protein